MDKIYNIKTGDRGLIILLNELENLGIISLFDLHKILNNKGSKVVLNIESWGLTKTGNKKDYHPNGGFKRDYEYHVNEKLNARLEYLRGVRDGSSDYSEQPWTDSDVRDMLEELEELEK